MKDRIVLAFVPVLHQGYLNFFQKYSGCKLLLFGRELYSEQENLTREIRAIDPELMAKVTSSLGIFSEVAVAGAGMIRALPRHYLLVLPDEDISQAIADKHLFNHDICFENVFLRFDMAKTLSQNPVVPDYSLAPTDFEQQQMALAYFASLRSPDWWRQVGALIHRDKPHLLMTACNTHMPSQHSLYALGDPRNNFNAGEHIEISSAHHAEKVLISRAARDGVALAGASIYVTTFPCPSCAADIVGAGISKVYYSQGYSLLLAQEVFKSHGVQIIHVPFEGIEKSPVQT